ncbi:MAG: peptide chain release factor 1 [Campylobacterota bacterium]
MKEKLQPFIDRHHELNDMLSAPEVMNDVKKITALSKEQADLKPLYEKAKEYIDIVDSIAENKELLEDDELGELAKEEIRELEPKIKTLEEQIKILMLPKDPNDDKNIYLEIRAGTGGDESALFVEDMFKAYLRYAEKRGYKAEIVSSSDSNAGGYKEMILLIKGEGAYSRLKYEGGTHRVQRVPETESQGRVHTSAVTVAVMPEVDDVEVNINPGDIKMDVFRASGCGGQSVNTTDSAVRLTHVPTGVVVAIQDEKSQHKNRDKAMKVLKARIYEKQMQQQLDENAAARKSQVGSGDRSGRIRTYNYPQNRVTDHRINLTLYRLSEVMDDGQLDLLVDPLIADARTKAMQEAGL